MSIESRPRPPVEGGENLSPPKEERQSDDLAQTIPERPPRSPEDFTVTPEIRPASSEVTIEIEPTPALVAASMQKGEEQEREEAQGEMTKEREDELNARLTSFVIKHPECGIDNPLEYIRQDPKRAELRIKGLEFKVARDTFDEMHRKWYGASDEIRDRMREEYEKKSKEFDEARTEYVGESAARLLRERIRTADKAAEERIEKRGWMGKVYDTWKMLGDLNLDRALSNTRFAPKGKFGKFAARFASVRTAISASLLGAGAVLGAGTAVGVGAIALRRVFAGLGSGFGSYDLLRNATNRWAETRGWRREVSEEEARTMPKEEILKRLDHIEAWALLNGKKVSEIPTYQILLDQYHKGWLELEMRAELEQQNQLEVFISGRLEDTQYNIDQRLEDLRIKHVAMQLFGVTTGLVVGSGIMAKVVREFFGHGAQGEVPGSRDEARDALLGKAEAPPSASDSQIVAHGSSGESATLNPDGTIKYAPPAEGAPPAQETTQLEPLPPQEIIVEVNRGDNVWKVTARALSERFGQKFDELDSARKSYVIDAVKDQFAQDPQKHGFSSRDLIIRPGNTLNFTNFFNDPEMERIFNAAKDLSEEKVTSILEHQQAVREFLREHPDYKLRPGDIDRIIRGELTDANYEASLKGGELPKVEILERPRAQPVGPVVSEAPTAARLGMRFAPGYSGAEQEIIARRVDYFRDEATALREKVGILEKFHGNKPQFSQFAAELNQDIARLENQANGLVQHAERVEDVKALKEVAETIGWEPHTPYADATAQALATGQKFGIIPNEVAGYDVFVDAKEASRDIVRNQNFLASHAEVPKGHFAEGFVRDATGEPLARFEYSPNGAPQSVIWQGRPDMKVAKSFLAADWEKSPSSLEKSKILNNALNLERFNRALGQLSRAGEIRSPEANLLRDAIAVVKKKLGTALRIEFRR